MKYFEYVKSREFFKFFYYRFNKLSSLLIVMWFFCIIFGLVFCLLYTSVDYQQKIIFKLIYIHVPSALLSIFIYCMMGFFSFLYIFFDIKIAAILAKESVKVGILFTSLALLTGSLWAKPMWGTWWVWDARLSSELILLFLYFGYSGLHFSIKSNVLASKCCAIFNLVGIINVPIIHYSVKWWYTLHQGYTLQTFFSNSIAFDMLYPLVFVIFVSFLFYFSVVCFSSCTTILECEKNRNWVFNEFKNMFKKKDIKSK